MRITKVTTHGIFCFNIAILPDYYESELWYWAFNPKLEESETQDFIKSQIFHNYNQAKEKILEWLDYEKNRGFAPYNLKTKKLTYKQYLQCQKNNTDV